MEQNGPGKSRDRSSTLNPDKAPSMTASWILQLLPGNTGAGKTNPIERFNRDAYQAAHCACAPRCGDGFRPENFRSNPENHCFRTETG